MTNSNRKKRNYDKALKKVRDRLKPAKMQLALREAILGVVGMADEDRKSILESLWEQKKQFKNIHSPKQFKSVVIAWVVRQAQLIVNLRELLAKPNPFKAKLLYSALHSYDGDASVDALGVWAKSVMEREAEAIAAVPGWVSKYRKVVYKGIWSVLGGCLDLGVGSFQGGVTFADGSTSKLWHPTVEEIASEVWLWMYQDAYDLATSPVPISSRLYGKAEKQAIKWRTERIEERRLFVSQSTMDEKREFVEKLIETADRSFVSGTEYKMLEWAETSDIADMRQLDDVFEDVDLNYDANIANEYNDRKAVHEYESAAGETSDELEELSLVA